MDYLATTVGGVEDVAERELHGKVVAPGRVLFKKLLSDAKSVHRVIALLADFTFSSFDDLCTKAGDVDLLLKGTFKIQCERTGEHGFKSPDVEKALGVLVRNKGFVSSFKEPDNVIVVDIIGDRCFMGLLVEDNLCRRAYRVRFNNQSIHSCVAYVLVQLAGAKKDDVLLDPFCKDGVIAIEAYLAGVQQVHAFDPNKNNVRNAMINVAMAKVPLKVKDNDISWATTLFREKTVDCIVTNIFLSQRDKYARRKVSELFEQADFVLKKKMLLITNKPALVKESAKQLALEFERMIVVGGMTYTVLCYFRS